MQKNHLPFILLTVLLVSVLCGCANIYAHTPTGENTPQSTADPMALKDQPVFQSLYNDLRVEVRLYPFKYEEPYTHAAYGNREAALSFLKDYWKLLEGIRTRIERDFDIPVILRWDTPSWQWVCGLYHGYQENFFEALKACTRIKESLKGEALVVELSFCKTLKEEQLIHQDKLAVFNTHFMTAYLSTVYDDHGVERESGEEYTFPEGYVENVLFPLPGYEKRVKDSWYAPRSQDTRYHTGTDIKAREKTPILSCTDGEVLAKGFSPIPGNYVVIEDSQGFEYHYYHLYEPSALQEGDRVKQGDVAGLVGNTGNSDANHLHLAIITPDGEFINPYYLMKETAKR